MVTWPNTILLATDGSEDAALAATSAASFAKTTDSELHIISVGVVPTVLSKPSAVEPVWVEQRTRKVIEEQVKKIENLGVVVAQSHVRSGLAAEKIVKVAEEVNAGLIIMGCRGRGGVRRALLGSVSDSVVRHAHCSVLVVRPEK